MSAAVQESLEPATGHALGTVAVSSADDVARAVAGAAAVQPLWAQLRLDDRARYKRRAAQAVIDEFDELVELICREQGRPRAEAELMEVLSAVELLRWLAEEGPGILGDDRVGVPRMLFGAKRARITHEPRGVIAVISTAAEPFAGPLGDVAIALMAGNGVVLKPSPFAFLCGERVRRVFARAGLPEGLLQVVHGGSDTGAALVEARAVRQVRLTGSTPVGRAVGEACARLLKESSLALVGKDAMLVLEDAPLERAIPGAVWAAFANAGQAPGSVERVYVMRSVHDRFLAGVVAGAEALRLGDPREPRTEVGPLARQDRATRVRDLVDDAVRRGATLACGGPREGRWFAPTVLTGVPDDAAVLHEDVPGPVLVVVPVDDVDEAIRLANAGDYGLGASIWTADRARGARIARALHVGMVFMNDHQVASMAPRVPWGGIKESGLGRSRGAAALRECTADKVLTWDATWGRAPWWHPYDKTLTAAGEALVLLRSVRDRDRSRAWRDGAFPVARLSRRVLGR